MKKNDSGKPRWYLLPWIASEEVVKVLTFGATKYCEDGWKEVPNATERYFSAISRHLSAWHKGEKYDNESGLRHLAHAACCILFMLELSITHKGDKSKDAE